MEHQKISEPAEIDNYTSPSLHRILLSRASVDSFDEPSVNSSDGPSVASSDEIIDSLVDELIDELSSPSNDLESLHRAVTELRLLTKYNPENRIQIAHAGAVQPLISLLSHQDPILQENGVTALLNLSLCNENKALIAEAGAIQPLVRALKSGPTAAARENAACTLLRLSQLDGLATVIGRAGAIPLLINLLETSGPCGKKDAATTLYSLCNGSRENRLQAVQHGAVRPLLELMADSESGMVDKAAYVLYALVTTSEGRDVAVQEGGIPVIVEMVQAGTQRQKEIATLALLQICKENSTYRTMVAREGAIPSLVALSQSSNAKSKLKTKDGQIDLISSALTGCSATVQHSTVNSGLPIQSTQLFGTPPNDGYTWRKYGQKSIKSSLSSHYYICTFPDCPAKKKVQRDDHDQISEIVCKGIHTHARSPNRYNPGYSSVPEVNNSSTMDGSISGLSVSKREREPSGEDTNDKQPVHKSDFGLTTRKIRTHTTVTLHTKSEADILDDGFRWRKYGQSDILGSLHARSYYRCTHLHAGGSRCEAKKQVQRSCEDPTIFITTYIGTHNHQANANSTSSNFEDFEDIGDVYCPSEIGIPSQARIARSMYSDTSAVTELEYSGTEPTQKRLKISD